MSKPILCLDFDGVCHSYTSGWKGVDVIPDLPVDGMWSFLEAAFHHFELHIFSSRSSSEEGLSAMREWFLSHADSGFRRDIVLKYLKFDTVKPPAFITLDDRCILFEGVWPNINELLAFRPWNKK